MAQSIWKYAFETEDRFTVEMPDGAKILSVQVQHDVPCMWAMVDPDAPLKKREFTVRGTGHPIEGWVGNFIGTYQLMDGYLVFHLFETGGPR